jgi:hypothetical protein
MKQRVIMAHLEQKVWVQVFLKSLLDRSEWSTSVTESFKFGKNSGQCTMDRKLFEPKGRSEYFGQQINMFPLPRGTNVYSVVQPES